MHVLITCKYKKDQIKKQQSISKRGLSVAMETRVLTQSVPKPFPQPSDATQNLIKIGQLASEIFKFEIVDDDGQVSSKPFYMLFEKQMHKMCIKSIYNFSQKTETEIICS